jgi:hypothetical protein
MFSARVFASLLAVAVLAGCWSHKGPPPPTFSPNGEPLVPPQWPADCASALDAWFDRLDTGHTGGLTHAQLQEDALRQFKLMDLRHDGKVTAEELSKYRLAIMHGHYLSVSTPAEQAALDRRKNDEEARPGDRIGGEFGDGSGDDNGSHHRHGEDHRPVDAYAALVTDQPDPVMSADSDLDGSVTWDEFRALVDQDFADFDKDHEGKITKSEVETICARSR